MKKEKPIFIISGPSGAGEDSVIGGLKKYLKIERVITTVTRGQRKGEKQGQPYYFISVAKFKKMIAAHQFIEWSYGYGDYRGCTLRELERVKKSGRIGMWKVEYKGVRKIKRKLPEIIAIYIKPPSLKIAMQRLIKRGTDSPATIKKRVSYTRKWLDPKNDQLYDYIVINRENKLQQTIEKTLKIIKEHLPGLTKKA